MNTNPGAERASGVSFDEELTLGSWLSTRAKIDGEKTAVDDRGVTSSYKELALRAENLAQGFLEKGYKNGDRVVSVTGNSVDHIVLFFACARAGLVLCPLSWRLRTTELAELLERTQPALIVYEDEYQTLADEAARASNWSAPMQQIGAEGIEESLAQSTLKDETQWREVRADDPLLMIFTSGSESKPKGVLLTHANCFWNNMSLAGASGLGPQDTALCVLPQFHVGGWNIYPLLALKVGATLVLERTFQPRRVIDLIEKRRVTVMMGVPTQYKLLSLDDAFANADLSSLRVTQVGGAALSQDIITVWKKKGIDLSPGYGLTEASPNVLYTPAKNLGGGMQPYPHVRVRLKGDETLRGELQIQGPGVFPGYFNDEAATGAAFTSDGWLKTGDIAEYDTHGSLHIVGRIKEIYISGGENVAPAEVEEAVLTHAAVQQVAVVGTPDPVWGEVGCAFVELKESADFANDIEAEQSILQFVSQALAAFKVPKRVIVLDEIPRIGIDKVDRIKLRARALELSEGVQSK